MGLVTVTSIWSMGKTPLSTPTTMRGKFVSGKDRDRNGERQIDAHRDQREDDEDDGLAVARGPVRRVRRRRVVIRSLIWLSASPRPSSASLAGFSSGAFSSSSGASFTVVSITLTLALSSSPMPPTITTSSPGRTPLRICTLSPSRTPSFTLRAVRDGIRRDHQARPCRLLRPEESPRPAPPVAALMISVTIGDVHAGAGLELLAGIIGLHPDLDAWCCWDRSPD